VGRLVAGTENLNRVVREPLPPNPPAPFVAAQTTAQKLLAATTPRIPKLRIHVDGAPADQVAVTVDGVNVPSVLLDADRPTDPGDHEVAASAPGFRKATAPVKLVEGAQQSVSLTLEVDPNAAPTATANATAPTVATQPVPAPAPAPAAPVAESKGSSNALAIFALGVGGAGVVAGSVFGVMALGTKSNLDKACPTKSSCPSTSQSDIDSLSTQAWIANIGFALGIVGAATGVILLATSHGGSERQAAAKPHVAPWVGVGTAGLGGTFE
jgi:hypothetical protein